MAFYLPILFGLAALVFVYGLFRQITRHNVTLSETSDLWDNRNYTCPICSRTMQKGYILAGRGIIWAPRSGQPIGTFAHIGQALENTLSLSLPPALNMAWQCGSCQHLLVDYSKLVKLRKSRF